MDDLDLGATIKGFSPGQKVFGRYTLKKILGRGGMGVVWLAQDGELEREVALKFLPEIVALDPEALADLKRETRRNLDLTHPHIVRIYDFVADSRTAAISMEYVNGASLSTLKLDQPGRVFAHGEIRGWLGQLTEALSYAHNKAKVVHRDLKPANLMINKDGDLKITDFGIARGISDSVSRVSAQAGGSSGTPVYMSPQQMMGEKPAVTDDIYALGATFYELLTGKPPFYSGNVFMQVQSKRPPTIAERRQELEVTGEAVPEDWEQTIAACLAKDPAARPQTMTEVAQRLGLAGGSMHRLAPRPDSPVAARPAPVVVPPLAAPAPPPVRPPQISTPQLAKRAINFVALCALGVNLLVFFGLLVSDELTASNLGFLLLVNLFAFAICWTSLFVVYLLWRAVFGWNAPETKSPGLPWMRTSLLAAVIPWAALNGWYLLHLIGQPNLLGQLIATSDLPPGAVLLAGLIAYSIDVTVFTLLLTVLRAWKRRDFWLYVAYFSGTGGALTTLAYAEGVMFAQMELAGGTLVLSGLAAAVVWGLAGGAAHHLLFKERPSFGPQRNLVLGALALAVAVAGFQLFVALPEEVQLAEYRAEQEKQRVEAEAKLAEEARVALELAERRKAADGLVTEAWRMVFDRVPDATARESWIAKLVENKDWDAARLRQEMRAGPAGLKGGRLLVPTEFSNIQRAIDAAVPGNSVHVAAGTYAERIYLDKAVNLIGAGRDQVTVETDCTKNALRIEDVSGITISGFTFRHTDTNELEQRTFVVSLSGSSVRFAGNAIKQANGDGLWIARAGSSTVVDNLIHGGRWSGINVDEKGCAEIRNNEITANQSSGIVVSDDAGKVSIIGNEIRQSGLNGIWVAGGESVTMIDNRLSGNSVAKENYGGIGIGTGRPVLRGNTSRDNNGAGIWWNQEKARPQIGPGNISDGTELPVTP